MDVDDVGLPGGIVLDGEYETSLIHLVGLNFHIASNPNTVKKTTCQPDHPLPIRR